MDALLSVMAVLGQSDVSTSDIQHIIDSIMAAVNAAGSLKWAALGVAVVQVVIFVIKRIHSKFTKKYGALIILISSALMSILTLVASGNTWKDALLVFVASGASKFIHDLLHLTGILKHKETPAQS